ncbi:MarR family transcriptional regulator [Priestia megaterium]
MKMNQKNECLENWLSINNIQISVNHELESALQKNHDLSLNEFYVLYFLSQADNKRLRLQQLQELVGLSQSAMSRLIGRLEARSCGSLQRHICEEDRRGIFTKLTTLGEERLESALGTFHNMLNSSSLKEKLQQKLQSLVYKL